MLLRLLLVWLLLSLAPYAHAATYYVSTTGDNGNNGTSTGTAWATLQHAHDTATNGDTITILAGQYRQRVRITKNNMTWTGEPGTIVDGSTDLLTGWSDQGNGVYRIATPGYEPFELMALSTTAKLSVQKYANSMMNGTVCENCCGTGLQVLAFATDALCENRIYWDGWEAGWGVTGGFVYLRFREGENPDSMSVRVAPGATTDRGTFTIDGGDGNIIENMEIGGGLNAIALVNNADNNILRNNTLRNGRNQIFVGVATGTVIQNNSMDTRLIGSTAGYASTPYQAGDWSTTQHPETKPKLNIYHHNKFEVGLSGEQSGGIYCNPCGSAMTVDGNTIIGGTVGIHLDGWGTGAVIRNNTIGYQSAESVYYSEHYDAEIYGNTFFDNNSGIRIQDMEGYNGTKTGYIYRNHFHMALKFAEGIQFGFIVKEISPHTLYVYHNTFTMDGSQDGYALNLSGGDGTPPTAMPGLRAVNNIFSGIQMYPTSFLNCDTNGNDSLGMYSYNHSALTGENINGGSSGNCGNNTEGGPNPIWANPLTDVLYPPVGHAALDSAIRLDQTWTINGQNYSALPGMAGGYYPDTTPHRGKLQVAETDTTDPTVALTAPAPDATVSGVSVSITADASDNSGTVAGVQFRHGTTDIGAEDTSPPFAVTWDTTGVSNGVYALTAVARDPTGNIGTSTAVNVTVNNAGGTFPVIAFDDPLPGATVSGVSVRLSTINSDDVGIASVQFHVNGVDEGGPQCCLSTEITWDSTGVADGWHALTATACDAASNCTTTPALMVIVSNTADATNPSVNITAPSDLATVSGAAVAVTANASDNVVVVGVQFKLDGANLGAEDTTAPYAITWNTIGVSNGTHALTATVRDAAGNTATSATITVTVDNGGMTFLGDVTGLSVTASPTVAFLGEATGLNVSANSTVSFLGDVAGLGVSGISTVTFLGEVTSLNVGQP